MPDPSGTATSAASGSEVDQVSDGVLVHPFGDGAVAVDLITGQAYVVNAGVALLLAGKNLSVDELVSDLPEAERTEAREQILDVVDTLRTPGLIGRRVTFEERPEPTGSCHEPVGRHQGHAHPVLAQRISFRSDDEALIEQVDSFLGMRIDDEPSLFFDLVVNDDGTLDLYTEDHWHFLSREQFFSQLPGVLNDYAVRSHDVLALHAGAIRTPGGRTVVLMGHMNVGKSTLTSACVRAGCDYYSDETIGIGTDLGLVGYPKPITIDAETFDVLGVPGERLPHVGPDRFRSDVERLIGADRIDEILVVRFDPYSPALHHEQLEPVQALEALCAHTVNLGRLGQDGLANLCALAEHVPVSEFVHPGVEVAVPALVDP